MPPRPAPSPAKPAPKKVQSVPETKLKKTKDRATLHLAKVKKANEAKKRAKATRLEVFKRAERYMKLYKVHKQSLLNNKREAAKHGNYYVADEPRVAFVIRIRGINQVHPKVRKVLQLFRLLQINNGVFVKLNKATLAMLRIAEPQIAWGYPNMKTIHDLVYKRGFGKVEGRRTALNNNEIVEKVLRKHDVICMEDIVRQVQTCGPKFKQVTNFMWPFKLSNPKGGWRKKKTHFVEGGDFGNRETRINELVARML